MENYVDNRRRVTMVEQLDMFSASAEEITVETKKVLNLTDRQQALYELILNNSLNYGRKTTQREIYEKLKDYGYTWSEKDGTNHDHCSMIWSDINAINLEVEQVIISKNFEYWIGDEKETKEYVADLWSALEPRLKRYWKARKKIRKHGQGEFVEETDFIHFIETYKVEKDDELLHKN